MKRRRYGIGDLVQNPAVQNLLRSSQGTGNLLGSSLLREGDIGYQDPYLGQADPGVKFDPRQHPYMSDLYAYYMGGGKGIPSGRGAGDPAQIPGAMDSLVATGGGGGGGGQPTGIMAAGAAAPTGGAQNPLTQMVTTPTGETMTVKEAMTGTPQAYSIPGTMPLTPVSGAWGPQQQFQDPVDITQDPMTGDARIAEQIAAQDRASRVTLPSGDVFAAGDYSDVAGTLGDPTEKMDVTPEAQSAWQKVKSGLASVEDFITKFGPATYQALKGNIGGVALALGNPLAPLALAGQGIMGAIPEWSEADIAAKQYAKPSDQFDPSGGLGKDEFGINTRSDFSGRTYEDRIDDRIAELEARDATIGNKEGGYHENELNTLKNRQKEMGTPDYETGEHWDIEPGKPFRDTDKDIITPPKKPEQDLDLYDEWRTIIDAPESVYQEPPVAGPFDYMQPGYQTPLDREALGTDLEGVGITPFKEPQVPYDDYNYPGIGTPTGLDLAKGQPVYDERLGWIDPVTEEPVADPNIDPAITSMATTADAAGSVKNVIAGYQRQIDSLRGQRDKLKDVGIDPAEIDKAIQDIENKIKGIKPTKASFETDVTDKIVDYAEDFELPEDRDFDYGGDYEEEAGVKDTYGPTYDISDIGGEDEEDYGVTAPTPAPTPTVPDFISGGGRDESPSRPDPTPDFSGYDAGGYDPAPAPSGPTPGVPAGAGPPSVSGGGGGSGGGCFLPDTPITMANGSTKPVKDVDIGDEVAKGGKVFAAGRFLINNLHDYKGIKVSGSHMVNEDGKWTRIEDSKYGKPLGDDEHVVYVFGAENRRILINNILFTDYFEVHEQDKLSTIGNKYFKEWKEQDKIFVKLEEKHNVAMLNS